MDLRQACFTPLVAQKFGHSAINGRTTWQGDYALSIRHRKRIEEAMGWAKSIGVPKRPDLARNAARAQDAMPGLIMANWLENQW